MKIFTIVMNVIFYLAALALFLFFAAYIFMEILLFPSPNTGRRVGNRTLRSGDAVLDVYYHKSPDHKPVILYSHGNNEYLAKIKPWLNQMIKNGYSVLAYDYAGYGGSTGKASIKQAQWDIEAAYHFLTIKEKFQPGEIIVMGYSVGSGPSTWLATRYKIRKLVLIAPFASAAQVFLPWQLPLDKFKNAELLSKRNTPVLLFHGDKDWRIPHRNSETIYEYAIGPKKLVTVEGANHRDIFKKFEKIFWKELSK